MKRFAWWNQFGNTSPTLATARAIQARLDCLIIKAGFINVRDHLRSNSAIPFATEIYAYPDRIDDQVNLLRQDVAAGASFVVLNCEHEWEPLDDRAIRDLVDKTRALGKPVYACTDTRGARMARPYQQVLGQHCTGWMPMIYPKTFHQTPAGAFAATLDGKDFRGKPVIPAIQTYDNIGSTDVIGQIQQCIQRGLAGFGAYTIGHATDDEWRIIASHATPPPPPTPTHEQRNKAGDIFVTAGRHALRGQRLPDTVAAQIRYLMQ